MSAVLIIGIVVLLAAAVVAILSAAGRRRGLRDARGHETGRLSGETRSRDAEASDEREPAMVGATSEARERAAETRELATTAPAPATRKGGAVAERTPLDEDEIGISRRQFFNRGIILSLALAIGAFGAAALSFLYSKSTGGFGGKIGVDLSLSDVLAYNADKKEPYYVPEGRSYLVPYPKEDISKAKAVPQYEKLIPAMEQGIVALYQKCVHLGCKVPWCQSSQWFECPCHGSKYNRVGEKRGGPAPRGLDHFVLSISGGGSITIDTSTPITGAPIGTDTTGQGAEGPPCVGG